MRLCSLVAVGAVLSVSLAAHADTLSLASFSSGNSAAGAANSSVTYGASGTTYTLSPNGVWAAPLGNSTWVSYNSGTYPTNSGTTAYTAPNGTYVYQTTFTASDATSGYVQVMADDTTSVYLNGILVGSAGTGEAAHCTVTVPNCEAPATFDLPGTDFTDGLNTLTFDVSQLYNNGTGLDFVGSVTTGSSAAVTPEPSSFLLLGTGLLGAAGVLRRRISA